MALDDCRGTLTRSPSFTARLATACISRCVLTLSLRCAAEETLLNRALMVVSPEAYDEFLKRLDRPAQPNERLKWTMQNKVRWKTA